MATTCFFEKVIRDQKYGVAGDVRENAEISLEFGRSSFYSGCSYETPSRGKFSGQDLIYLTIDDKTVIVDQATAKEICDAFWELGVYFGWA